jgi:hypothetical protein
VSISLSGNWLKTTTNGGHVYSSSGYDIIFRAFDGVTQLDHEIEKYDGTNGVLVAWVRVPNLFQGNQNTTIYIYYGDSGITSPTANPNGVWDSNFVGVWHLKESGNGTLNEFFDSTSKVNHGTGGKGYSSFVPTQSAGKVGYGQTFDGTNDLIDMANSGWFDSAWPYRKKVLIQGSQVAGTSDLSNFPVLIKFTRIATPI